MLKLENIAFGFSPKRILISDLSITIEQGKVYALMGSNGAGKTTLFNIISGFIIPNKGSILFNNLNITKRVPYKKSLYGIGRTFQDLRIITKLTVKENIVLSIKRNPTDNLFNAVLPSILFANSKKVIEDKAEKIAEQFFLTNVKDSLSGEISYGQQKLLTMACCIASDATLLLLDEPVAGIQPEYRNKIALLIKQLKKQGKAILIIEHNTDFISEIADEVFFLHNGKISAFENNETLKKDKQVLEAYM